MSARRNLVILTEKQMIDLLRKRVVDPANKKVAAQLHLAMVDTDWNSYQSFRDMLALALVDITATRH